MSPADAVLMAAIKCLAVNAYHEARSEPFQGQVAVSQVVLRRASYDKRRVCATIRRPGQFSWVGARPGPPRNRAAYLRAWRAAQVAMLWGMGAPKPDYSAGADHYHANYVSPSWARTMTQVAVIGDHHFFRRRGHP